MAIFKSWITVDIPYLYNQIVKICKVAMTQKDGPNSTHVVVQNMCITHTELSFMKVVVTFRNIQRTCSRKDAMNGH